MRNKFFVASVGVVSVVGLAGYFVSPGFYFLYAVLGPLILIGTYDALQTRHTILRNFPIVGHFRYWLELIRPEIQQYFIESFESGRPFSREQRSVVYQRAKGDLDTVPFGTQLDLYAEGAEWIGHSINAKAPPKTAPRVQVGSSQCSKPYSAALLNISAMSYGSLSKNALLALNQAAREGSFYHNTGEGAISPYHLRPGGDLVWQIGTGYFGCRDKQGNFSDERFKENATRHEVKMIEIKLSQGAKPGHGGILPAKKVDEEVARIRGVEVGKQVLSPPSHSAFRTPLELMKFLGKLRDLSGGKPVGFKLCVGKTREFVAICKAIVETNIFPDFITVDGAEGGTGAAPLEFTNSIGMPLAEGLVFVHNVLVGMNLRSQIKIIASGKVTTGFTMATKFALGADICNSARGMMFALGCIQALRCNSNTCPTGVATQDEELVKGLVVREKAPRVARFQRETIHGFLEVLGAAGLDHPNQLRPWHIHRRVSSAEVKHYGEIFQFLEPGQFYKKTLPTEYARAWENSAAHTFEDVPAALREVAV